MGYTCHIEWVAAFQKVTWRKNYLGTVSSWALSAISKEDNEMISPSEEKWSGPKHSLAHIVMCEGKHWWDGFCWALFSESFWGWFSPPFFLGEFPNLCLFSSTWEMARMDYMLSLGSIQTYQKWRGEENLLCVVGTSWDIFPFVSYFPEPLSNTSLLSCSGNCCFTAWVLKRGVLQRKHWEAGAAGPEEPKHLRENVTCWFFLKVEIKCPVLRWVLELWICRGFCPVLYHTTATQLWEDHLTSHATDNVVAHTSTLNNIRDHSLLAGLARKWF